MTPPDLNLSVVGPIAWVGIGAMLVLLGEVLLSRVGKIMGRPITTSAVGSVLAAISIISLLFAAYMATGHAASGLSLAFNPDNPMFQLDRFSALVTAVIAVAALLSCLLSVAYLDELHINHGEYYALVLFSTSGMMLMIGAVDMLPVFLGFELMSIPIYGVALLYGVAGSTSFEAIRAAFDPSNPMALVGLGLVVVGFAFKVSSVPFHQWTPDVYEGAPSAVTAFMSVTVKLAAFAALLRVLTLCFDPLGELMQNVFWTLAALTMIVGNVMAVIQDNIKRLLAYSSIAHAGYLLIGFVPGTSEGYAAVVFYLICYLFMNLGAFGVVVVLAHRGKDCERMESLAGLATARPGLAALMTLFMVSLAGIPGTAGFMGKFVIFSAAVGAGFVPLAVLGVLMSAISVYYYIRVPVLMYMREPSEEGPRLELSTGEGLVLLVCAFGVLYLGIFPNNGSIPFVGDVNVLDWARDSVRFLLAS